MPKPTMTNPVSNIAMNLYQLKNDMIHAKLTTAAGNNFSQHTQKNNPALTYISVLCML